MSGIIDMTWGKTLLLIALLLIITGSILILRSIQPSEKTCPLKGKPIGYASINALGQDGTTGGAEGETVIVQSREELEHYASQDAPYTIYVAGNIKGAEAVKVSSHKTIIGKSQDAALNGFGLRLQGVQNIIVRNLAIANTAGKDHDAISIKETHHVWIDHCELSNGTDGLIDITRESDYVTVSYTIFRNHSRMLLIGHSSDYVQDRGKLKVTIHHNIFKGHATRAPSVRYGRVHVYNNLYDGLDEGIWSRDEAKVLVENNYFLGVDTPMDAYPDGGASGEIFERSNIFKNNKYPFVTRGGPFTPEYEYVLDDAGDLPGTLTQSIGLRAGLSTEKC